MCRRGFGRFPAARGEGEGETMEKILFTDGWRYGLKGAEKRPVILPHDAMQLQRRHPDEKSGSGGAYFPGGVYCYEKLWQAPAEYAGKRLLLHFEGVYRNATVRVNGKTVGSWRYGYSPFRLDVTDAVRAGESNRIEVEADNSEVPNSRWYSGGGIYRPVWLWVGGRTRIEPYGLRVKTVSLEPAVVQVSVDTNAAEAELEILRSGRTVATATGVQAEITIPDAALWDETNPALYTCRAVVKEDGAVADTAETTFGIRMVTCSPQGLFVNGEKTLLRGGCIHSDNGVLGAASFPEAEYRKARLLKDAGFNALRIAHNPASPALLDACDRLGLYVMDEGWDMWYKRKTRFDYGLDFMDNYEADIRAMVETDYNHPSVLFYSIGNEISEPAEQKGVELAGKLADAFRRLDDTRLVTVGCNIMILYNSQIGDEAFDPNLDGSGGTFEKQFEGMDSTKFNELTSQLGAKMELTTRSPAADRASAPLFEKVDVAGYNYAYGRYELEGGLHPERVIVGSETFPQCIYRNWEAVKAMPYLIGDFMWTALDYIGEVGVGAWAYDADGAGFTKPYPWLLAEVGAMDLLGTPTGELYLAQAAWDLRTAPAIAVSPDVCHPGVVPAKGGWRGSNAIPSWSFAGCAGNPTSVEVYSRAPSVELRINGSSLGVKAPEEGVAAYDCVYEPGVLEAFSYDASGNQTGYSRLESAQGATTLRLTQEPGEKTGPGALVFVDVELVGENGVVESCADRPVTVTVEGGTLLGFGSARSRTEERFTAGVYTTCYGRALAAVLLGPDGKAVLTAKTDGEEARLSVR